MFTVNGLCKGSKFVILHPHKSTNFALRATVHGLDWWRSFENLKKKQTNKQTKTNKQTNKTQ